MEFPDKFKVRISRFVYLTIVHDCIVFKCIKKNGEANITKFINNLLPTLIDKRDILHNQIKEKLYTSKLIKNVNNKDEYKLLGELETILDIQLSTDYLLDELSEEIWLRADKNTQLIYDQIWNIELGKYNLDFSQYIRLLLNDYCAMQQFKREELYFYKVLKMVRNTSHKKPAIEAKINNEYMRILPIEFYSDYAKTGMTYLIFAKEWDDNNVFICNIRDITINRLVQSGFSLHTNQINIAYEIIDSGYDISEEDLIIHEVKNNV